jgi:hypothetical protein
VNSDGLVEDDTSSPFCAAIHIETPLALCGGCGGARLIGLDVLASKDVLAVDFDEDKPPRPDEHKQHKIDHARHRLHQSSCLPLGDGDRRRPGDDGREYRDDDVRLQQHE